MPILTPGMLRDRTAESGSHACLTLKAWNTRVFLVFLDHVFQEHLANHDGANDVELLLAAASTKSLTLWFLEQETANRRFLSAAEARSIAGHGMEYLGFIEALARCATQNGILRWKLLPKHHEHQQHHGHICFKFDLFIRIKLTNLQVPYLYLEGKLRCLLICNGTWLRRSRARELFTATWMKTVSCNGSGFVWPCRRPEWRND